MRAEVRRATEALRSGFVGDPEALRRYAAGLICQLLGAQGALWYEVGMVGERALPTRWVSHGTSDLDCCLERWLAVNVTWGHFDPRRPRPEWLGRFRTLRQITPDLERQLYPTAFWQRVLNPAQITDQARMMVVHRGELVGWIGAFRFRTEPDFTRSELARLAPVTDALADALVAARAGERVVSAEEGCDLLLTADGLVEYASETGAGLVRTETGRRALAQWVARVDAGGPAAPVVFGMAVRWQRMYAPGRVRYLLHLEPPRPVRLDPLHALTPAQRRVAELAAKGLTAPEVGEILAIRAATVRSHLKAIYARLHIASRAELAEVYLQGEPRHAPAHGPPPSDPRGTDSTTRST